MKIYFVRHGLAEDRHEWYPIDDFNRPLTDLGVIKMEKSAQTIRKLGIRPGVILTSPLVRARQTADIVGEALGCDVVEERDLAPGFDIRDLATLVGAYHSAQDIMVVGHEPDFSMTIEDLVGGGRVAVKKGSLIRVDVTSFHPLNGELVWMIPPKMLAL